MATMLEVLRSVLPDLENRDLVNRKEWYVICAMNVTTSRRQASHFWEILCTMKVLVPINGTTWRVNHDALYGAVGRCNSTEIGTTAADGGSA